MAINLISETSRELIIKELSDVFFNSDYPFSDKKDIEVANDLLNFINKELYQINLRRKEKEQKELKYLSEINTYMVVQIILKQHHVALIDMIVLPGTEDYTPDINADPSSEHFLFAVYNEKTGLYHSDDIFLHKIINRLRPNSVEQERKEIYKALKMFAPIKPRNLNYDYVPVNNGIFDYKTKKLLPFTPDVVFLTKSKVDYKENAQNVVIENPDGTTWDIESWIEELSDNPEIVNLLWQIIGANIRCEYPWGKSAWFHSPLGSNGKGTFCQLLRNITGNAVSISIPQFKNDAYLSQLVRATNIVVDENPVGSYLDDSASLKAVSTLDLISINRKYKEVISLRFKGFMVQCVNDMPKVQDRSPSFLRRQIIIPWRKRFIGASDKKYIKSKYIARKDVLEYVLKRVLEMNYYELDIPEECEELLAQYRHYNDPLAQFYDEVVMEELRWNFLPYTFLHDLYKKWYAEMSPEGKPFGRNKFNEEINILAIDDFKIFNKSPYHASREPFSSFMTEHEPLILEYNLEKWQNPRYKGPSDESRTNFKRKSQYRGLLRREPLNDTEKDTSQKE